MVVQAQRCLVKSDIRAQRAPRASVQTQGNLFWSCTAALPWGSYFPYLAVCRTAFCSHDPTSIDLQNTLTSWWCCVRKVRGRDYRTQHSSVLQMFKALGFWRKIGQQRLSMHICSLVQWLVSGPLVFSGSNSVKRDSFQRHNHCYEVKGARRV